MGSNLHKLEDLYEKSRSSNYSNLTDNDDSTGSGDSCDDETNESVSSDGESVRKEEQSFFSKSLVESISRSSLGDLHPFEYSAFEDAFPGRGLYSGNNGVLYGSDTNDGFVGITDDYEVMLEADEWRDVLTFFCGDESLLRENPKNTFNPSDRVVKCLSIDDT